MLLSATLRGWSCTNTNHQTINIIGFTSWLNHEVKPITFGTRKSIVAFIGGKAWK